MVRIGDRMKDYILDKKSIVFFTTIWWAVFTAFSISQYNPFQLLNIIGFLFLILVPGLLTVLVLRLEGLEFWGYVVLSIGFSLLELVVVALLGNFTLPFLGFARPLDNSILLLEITFLIFSLLALNWWKWADIKIPLRRFAIFDSARDLTLALFPIVFVCMSVAGAMRLNNGLSGTVTLAMLIGIVIYLAVLIWYSRRVGPNVIPVALFFVSLSLLLMTSLRGWYITGHDIQREYRVFELAKNTGIWDISVFRDAYNACMSITILPTIFYNTLKFFDPYVYKIFFQIIFATVPSLVYLIAKRYTSETIALLATIYFIAFPTFFGDMPMLNRQEMAFVFFGLMIYVLFEPLVSLSVKQNLFVLFGIGVVISHYTTTYTIIAMLVFLICMYPVVKLTHKFWWRKASLVDSAIEGLNSRNEIPRNRVTVLMVVLLVLASFFWSSILTNTSSGSLTRVAKETFKVIQNNTKEDLGSGDVLYGLFSWQKFNPTVGLENYDKKIVQPARVKAPVDTYYSDEIVRKYPVKVVEEDNMPITKIGNIFASYGVNVSEFNELTRQLSAKFLQIFIIIGVLFVLVKKTYVKGAIDVEFFLLTIAGLLFVFIQIVVPILSVEYGILRAFQQGLFFSSIFLVIGSLVFLGYLRERIKILFASIFTILFFISSTGVITQLLGGYGPQLHLNNAGNYYDIYYLHGDEVGGIMWLSNETRLSADAEYQSEVQSDRYSFTRLKTIGNIDVLSDIYPGLVRKESYLYLGAANTNKKQATLSYNSDLITYTYPVNFLDENKDLIYSNRNVRIYR